MRDSLDGVGEKASEATCVQHTLPLHPVRPDASLLADCLARVELAISKGWCGEAKLSAVTLLGMHELGRSPLWR